MKHYVRVVTAILLFIIEIGFLLPYLFSAKSDDKYVIKAQIQESKLGELIAAIKSTAKNV